MSNAFPRTVKRICELYFSGRLLESLELQVRAIPLIRALFCETNPAPIKRIMNSLGYCNDELRLPLDRVNNASAEVIDKAAAEFINAGK
jgi:4-hydroxy-tetrahydrodipicolinate synthase